MPDRISPVQRIKLQSVAEREVMRYAGNHGMWHKHIHNVELDPVQLLKMKEMDQNNNTIDFSSRRIGKTAVKEMYMLEHNAIHGDQELGIVAPREAQSLVNLGYHLDAIRRSDILTNHLAYRAGRRLMSDTTYEFQNRSRARAYGIMAQVDGGDLTAASLEEVDDMPRERLFSRFLLMLGSTRRLGASEDSKNDPSVRVTGVFKGADTLSDLLKTGGYHALGCFHGPAAKNELQKLITQGFLSEEAVDIPSYQYPVPIANAVNGMELDLLQRPYIMKMKDELSEDEFNRQLLCVNTAARNLIWEVNIRRAMQIGLDANIQIAQPLPGETYQKRGLISFGYDAGGHGENPKSSRHALVVCEQIGGWTTFTFAKTWSPGADDMVVKRDLLSFWKYFMPDVAMGDAYGVGMLTALNDDLFAEGLTQIDRRAIGDGNSTASTWPEWAFSPIRFEGMTKHVMAQGLRNTFHNHQSALPYIDDSDESLADPELSDMRLFIRQLPNIEEQQTKTTYASYRMVDSKVGDDLFDAAMAANFGLMTRGAIAPATTVLTHTRTREELLKAG